MPDTLGPIYKISISDVAENENGGADYTFEVDTETAQKLKNLGLELVIHCGAYKVYIQDVFKWIKEQGDG